MPRKSARLLSKSKLQSQRTDSDDSQHKRRRVADVEPGTSSFSKRKQQFRFQNNRLSLSQTHAITTSMIVPSDEVDSLICPEFLALPQPTKSSNNWDEEEIVRVVSNPPQQCQLFRFSNHFQASVNEIACFSPLPLMDWADSQNVWNAMKIKEEKYQHSANIFLRHPDVKPNMRAVLLTWLTEVCEVYKLHKETYYLAVDFIDRFLLATENIKTSQLQLLGVTALFAASKIEEIYPPKSTEFAYVADGAFEVEDIHEYELFMIKALDWLLSPVTLNSWIQLYLQIAACQVRISQRSPSDSVSSLDNASPHSLRNLNASANSGVSALVACAKVMDLTESRSIKGTMEFDCFKTVHEATNGDYDTDSSDEMDDEWKRIEEESIVYPIYSPHEYLQVSRLIDLVILDSHSLQFKYSVLAAAVLFHTTEIEDVFKVTSLTWEELEPCIRWMKIHKEIINRFQPLDAPVKSFENITESDAHKIQYHSISKEMWEEALKSSENFFHAQSSLALLAEAIHQRQACPTPTPATPNFITPPRSGKKMSPENCLRFPSHEEPRFRTRPSRLISASFPDVWLLIDFQESETFPNSLYELLKTTEESRFQKILLRADVSSAEEARISEIHRLLKGCLYAKSDRKDRILLCFFNNRRKTKQLIDVYRGILPKFSNFVKLYQFEKPMQHKLPVDMYRLTRDFMGLFINPEQMPSQISVKSLKAVDCKNRENQVDVGQWW